MKTKKLVALLLCALLMVVTFSGCIGNMYKNVGTIDGTEISAGLYLMAEYNAYNDAKSLVDNPDKSVLKQKIDGEKASAWIKRKTEEKLKQYVLVHRLSRDLGISLSSDSQQAMEQTMQFWQYTADYYAELGIGQESFVRFNSNELLGNDVFNALYSEGGALYVPDSELKQEYADNNAHLRFFAIPAVSNEEGEDVTAQLEEMAADMVKKLQGGQTMEDVVNADMEKAYTLASRELTSETPEDNISTSYVSYDESSYALYSEEFVHMIKDMANGEYGYFNMGSTILIFEKIPAFSEGDSFEDLRYNILRSLKKGEYEEYLKEQYEDFEAKWSFGARWYYRPSKIAE